MAFDIYVEYRSSGFLPAWTVLDPYWLSFRLLFVIVIVLHSNCSFLISWNTSMVAPCVILVKEWFLKGTVYARHWQFLLLIWLLPTIIISYCLSLIAYIVCTPWYYCIFISYVYSNSNLFIFKGICNPWHERNIEIFLIVSQSWKE